MSAGEIDRWQRHDEARLPLPAFSPLWIVAQASRSASPHSWRSLSLGFGT
jgi:hypothetical protein